MRYALNAKEETVLSSLPSPSGGDTMGSFRDLEEIAKKAFGDQKRGSAPKSKGNSWVRNSMRKLLRLGLVVHAPGKSGQYARTKVTLKEIAAKEESRKASTKKQGDAAKPRTRAGKASKKAKAAKVKTAAKVPKPPKVDESTPSAEANGA